MAGPKKDAKKDLPPKKPVKAGRKAGGQQQEYLDIKP
jgi:hypothetical protein